MTVAELKAIITQEGDYKAFNYREYECLIARRHKLKDLKLDDPNYPNLIFLCGYVFLPDDHKLVGKDYSAPELENIDVHGGLTFSDWGKNILKAVFGVEGVLNAPWTLGFDCGHLGDIMVMNRSMLELSDKDLYPGLADTYKTFDYVETQLKSLVDQLADGASSALPF